MTTHLQNPVPLTHRETAVGILVVAGKTSADVGQELAISTRTAEKHIQHIRAKLGAKSHAAMVRALKSLLPTEKSATVAGTSLPAPRTSFVGRESELADIQRMMHGGQLVTLVGPPGVGKTRVALRVGADLADRFADGVWFIELARLSNAEHLEPTIARTMQLDIRSGADPLASLVRALSLKHALLILDNCEHVVDSLARVAAAILRECSNVHVLATTRRPLRISSERAYAIAALATPRQTDAASPDLASRFDAIALFVERARQVQPGFSLTPQNARAVGEICRRLDGNALAIELAAARIGLFTAHELCGRLNKRFALLTRERSSALSQHQTLFAAIQWSFDLLGEQQRTLFRRLAIFVGGWTLEAAEAVCLDAPEATNILDLIFELVDHSLVVVDFSQSDTRYSFLESMRQYADIKLKAADERDRIADRHFEYFKQLFDRAGSEYDRYYRQSAVLRLERDLDNARTAIAWSVACGRPQSAAALFVAAPLWSLCGLTAEERSRALALLDIVPPGDGDLIARLWLRVRKAAYSLGDNASAWQASQRAVEAGGHSSDAALRAATLAHFSFMACAVGRLDDAAPALKRAESAQKAAEDLGQPIESLRTTILDARMYFAKLHGDIDVAAHLLDKVRITCRELNNTTGETAAVLNLVDIEHARGNTVQAIALAHEYLLRARELPRQDMRAGLMRSLAGMLAAVDDIAGSKRMAREAVALFLELDRHPAMIATAIEHLALTLLLGGERERPARLAGYCDAMIKVSSRDRGYIEQVARERLMRLLSERLQCEELERLLAQGAMLSPVDAVREALANDGLPCGTAP